MTDSDRIGSLIPAVRLRRIQELLAQQGALSLRQAQAELNVSEMTVRRDFVTLEGLGAVERTWGGIMARRPLMPERDLAERVQTESEAKTAIAALIDQEINEGETVFLSGGTTAYAVALRLAHRSALTIITTSLPALIALVDNPSLVVIVVGGRTSPYNNDITGPQAERDLASYRADRAVIGATGITADGVFNANLDRAAIDRSMIEHANEALVVADHTKFGVTALTLVTPLLPTMSLVTDANPLPHVRDWFDGAGVDVIAPVGVADGPRRRRRPRPGATEQHALHPSNPATDRQKPTINRQKKENRN